MFCNLKRKAILIFAAALCVGLLAGCGFDGTSDRNSDEVTGDDGTTLDTSGMVRLEF